MSSSPALSGVFPRPVLPEVFLHPDPEALARTRGWILKHRRNIVEVEIVRGEIARFQALVNKEDYQCPLDLVPVTQTLWPTYYGREWPQIIPDPRSWWFNGRTLCNMESRDWGAGAQFAELQAEIELALGVTSDREEINATFFLNKRDTGYLTREDPGVLDPPVPAKRPLVPVLSQYGGPGYWDVMMPTSACQALRSKTFKPIDDEAFFARAPIAVFRGSATGPGVAPGSNQRIDLAILGLEHANLDVGITSYGNRDRVVQTSKGPPGKRRYVGLVDRPRPEALPPRVPRMSLEDQAAAYRFVVYVEGHAAALRYLELMLRGFVIFKVQSSVRSPDLWFFKELVDGEDHVAVSLSDLPSAVSCVASLPDSGMSIAKTAQVRGRRILDGAPGYLSRLLTLISREQSSSAVRKRVEDDPYWPCSGYC